MQDASPATPAATTAPATPGSAPAVITTPPATAPAASVGTVTLGTKEFAQLSRDAARGRSATRRDEIHARGAKVPEGASADTAQAINEANERAAVAERTALQEQVRGKVRDLLAKDEFKALPNSTRELIILNPSVLTQAATVEEAMLDIEDYVRDQVIPLDLNLGGGAGAPAAPAVPGPKGVETPPTGGTPPAPAASAELEDLSKLKGPARSQAAIRNALKTGATKA